MAAAARPARTRTRLHECPSGARVIGLDDADAAVAFAAASAVACVSVVCGTRRNASAISSLVRPFFSRNARFVASGEEDTCVSGGPGGERGRFGRSDGEAGRAGRRRGRRRAGRDGAVSPSLVSPRRAPASRAHLRVLQERDGVLDHVVAHGLGSVGLRPGQVVRVVAHGARCNARRQISALRRQTIVIDERAIKYSSSVRASRGRTSLPGNLSSLSSSGLSSSGAAFPDAHRPPARRERVCPRCMRRPRRPRRR